MGLRHGVVQRFGVKEKGHCEDEVSGWHGSRPANSLPSFFIQHSTRRWVYKTKLSVVVVWCTNGDCDVASGGKHAAWGQKDVKSEKSESPKGKKRRRRERGRRRAKAVPQSRSRRGIWDRWTGWRGGREGEREREREREAVTGIDTGTAICVHRWIHVLEHGCDQEQVRVWRSAWSLWVEAWWGGVEGGEIRATESLSGGGRRTDG